MTVRISALILLSLFVAIDAPGAEEATAPSDPQYLAQTTPVITFREGDGWSDPKRVDPFGDPEHDLIAPVVSPDGKYLFFLAWTGRDQQRPHWVEVGGILEE